MSEPARSGTRLGAYLKFVAALLYYFVARSVAAHAAAGLVSDNWDPIAEKAILAFLLLVGYAGMGLWLNRQVDPIEEQGFPFRNGWSREAAMGLATGWGIALVCVLPMMAVGGIEIYFSMRKSDWGWLAVDVAYFALWALVEEIAFRGYAFQQFMKALGPVGATLGFAVIYAILQGIIPGANHASIGVALAFTLLLSTVYLRTRALWLSWGINFGWKASRALVFGLAISGVGSNSPVVQGNPMGPFWLTGGAYGLDGSWIACIVFLAALPVAFRITSDLNYKYNAPVIVPGGIAVDLEAAGRAQHEAAMAQAAPAVPALVQIQTSEPRADDAKQGVTGTN